MIEKVLPLSELKEVSFRQSDKIIALRSVAKALECENELLSRENGRQIKGRDDNGVNHQVIGTGQESLCVSETKIFEQKHFALKSPSAQCFLPWKLCQYSVFNLFIRKYFIRSLNDYFSL